MYSITREEPCWLCDCDRTARPFTDCRQTAAWVATVKDQPGPPASPHPLLNVIGASRATVVGDFMHMSCLGAVQYLIASVLWDIISLSILAGSLDVLMHALWEFLREAFDNTPGQQTPHKFAWAMFRPKHPNQFPRLVGLKAKDTQTWIRALRQVCRHPEVQAGDLTDTLRVQALDSLWQV